VRSKFHRGKSSTVGILRLFQAERKRYQGAIAGLVLDEPGWSHQYPRTGSVELSVVIVEKLRSNFSTITTPVLRDLRGHHTNESLVRLGKGESMARLIPAAERIKKARALILKARQLPVPPEGALADLSYVAQVKDFLRQARDLIKFLPYSPGTSPEMKQDVESIFAEAAQAEKEILHP
jgi:hypothetical protein